MAIFVLYIYMWYSLYILLWMGQRNPINQLIGGKHPIIYRVSTIQGGAGLLPPTVCLSLYLSIYLYIYTYIHLYMKVHPKYDVWFSKINCTELNPTMNTRGFKNHYMRARKISPFKGLPCLKFYNEPLWVTNRERHEMCWRWHAQNQGRHVQINRFLPS